MASAINKTHTTFCNWYAILSGLTFLSFINLTLYILCRLPKIYEEFYHTVNNADHEKDLRWWSNTHGVNMPMNWPQFEVSTDCFISCTFLQIFQNQQISCMIDQHQKWKKIIKWKQLACFILSVTMAKTEIIYLKNVAA